MPYGVDKSLGGDSKENVAWMERCVDSVMKTGKPKSNAVAICKSQLRKKKEKNSSLEDVNIDIDIITKFDAYKKQYISKARNTLDVDLATANAMFDVHLARNNFIWS